MNQQNPFNPQNKPKSQPPRYKAPANFIEALKETGGSIAKNTAHGLTHDLIGGVAKQTMDTIFNSPTANSQQQQSGQQENFDFENFMRSQEQREQQIRQQQQVKYEYQESQVEIFNQRHMETDKKIEAIKLEIQKIAHEIVHLDKSIQVAANQEIVDPGTYHVNFFEKLLSLLKIIRKRVVESRHWAGLQAQRSHAKSYYWQQANNKVSGTKFSLSSERSVVTQTG